MSAQPIVLHLEAAPQRLDASSLQSFRVTLTAENRGPEVIDPELRRTQLLINGTPSRAWSLTVGNGKRPPAWDALPPGRSVSMTWPGIGLSLFLQPGRFDLQLVLDDARSNVVHVTVEP